MEGSLYTYIFIGFTIGLLIGGWAGYFIGSRNVSFSMKSLIGFLVTFIWAIGMIISFVNPAFQFPAILHGIFGGIVTSLYGGDALSAINKKS